MEHDVKTYHVTLLSASREPYTGSLGRVFFGAVEMAPEDYAAVTQREITIDHSLSCSDRDAYLRAEHAATNAAQQFFPDGLPEEAVFRVEHDGLVLEVDLEMIPQYRARKPRT